MIKDNTKRKQAYIMACFSILHAGLKELYIPYPSSYKKNTLSIQTIFFSDDHCTPSNKMADCKLQSAILLG
jgi:hypothetical protein